MKQEYILPMIEIIQTQIDDIVCTSDRSFDVNDTGWNKENDETW